MTVLHTLDSLPPGILPLSAHLDAISFNHCKSKFYKTAGHKIGDEYSNHRQCRQPSICARFPRSAIKLGGANEKDGPVRVRRRVRTACAIEAQRTALEVARHFRQCQFLRVTKPPDQRKARMRDSRIGVCKLQSKLRIHIGSNSTYRSMCVKGFYV